MYMNVGGTGGNPAQSDPASPNEFYNYLTGKWRDNTPFTIGGSGYNPLDPSAIPAQFAFPDNPSDPNGWSMCSVNLPYTDQRILPSHGPFTLAAGDTFTMRLAFTFHPDIPHPCPDINTWVKPTILQIQQWHDDGTLDEPLDLGSVQTLPPGQSLTLNASLANASAYNWSNGASTPSITVSQPGEYTVSVTRASGCESVETVLVKSATETAAPLLPEWRIQPNPASDVLYVVADEPLQNVTALLFNAQGEVVAQQFATGNRLEISAATLPSGLYWVLLQKDGNLLGSKKVMVVRR